MLRGEWLDVSNSRIVHDDVETAKLPLNLIDRGTDPIAVRTSARYSLLFAHGPDLIRNNVGCFRVDLGDADGSSLLAY